MGASPRWEIAPLDTSKHDRRQFACGDGDLDGYLKQLAGQDVRRNIARVFVATRPGNARILGYYTISISSFQRDDLPPRQAKRLPHYPVPAAIIGRLARDRSCRGQGLGEYLLMDALDRLYQTSRVVGIHAVIVDAIDDRAAAFYARHGFVPFPGRTARLFLPMATVATLVAGTP